MAVAHPLMKGAQYNGPIDKLYHNLHDMFKPYFGNGWGKSRITPRFIQPIVDFGNLIRWAYDERTKFGHVAR